MKVKKPATGKTKPTKEPDQSTKLFPVVGIGASAGGLEAYKKVLPAIPANSGMAYVLVQHIDPNHQSLLTELLQRVTALPVIEITDNILVQPDHIYVIPSNKMLTAKDNRLQLSPRPSKNKIQWNEVIDVFFTSLAEVYEAHAIGVVLSGTASDGTKGLKAIKEHGGITIAQNKASAGYEGMPNSAIESGFVDFILTPEKIPQKLLEISKAIAETGQGTLPENEGGIYKDILILLRTRKGMDFSYYKQSTVRRRIVRRMILNKFKKIASYLNYLQENKTEQDALYQDMLIPVTSFFRDKKIFDNLCESVFPNLIKNKPAEGHIRIWVAGCSTGEEAYSIAICFKEYLGHKKEKVQIFATDLSEVAIVKAKAGIYSKTDAEAVSPGRLKQYFTYTQGSYQVNKELRDMCVFATHNFLNDPPFGRIDFISCRNVLIYMDSYLQKKALATFHYALNPKGLLMLGKSENTIGIADLFANNGKNEKVFTRKDVPSKVMHAMPGKMEPVLAEIKIPGKKEPAGRDYQKIAEDLLLKDYIPAAVVVNDALDILSFFGNTDLYLTQFPGKPSHNLLKMAKMGLAFELRSILNKVKKEKKYYKKENILVQGKKMQLNISIEVKPLPRTIESYYLVLFSKQPVIKDPLNSSKPSSRTKKDDYLILIHQLEEELSLLREDMHTISEDQESSNEELQSTNEELLSSNEELQSMNEEMETSKEELQSTVEELTVVNEEMVNLNDQLAIEKNFAEAIITTIPQPLLVLDKHLRVTIANAAFFEKFSLTEKATEGYLMYDLNKGSLNIPVLRTLLEKIISKKESFYGLEIEVHLEKTGLRIFLLNGCELVREKGEKLILLVLEDITDLRIGARKIETSEKNFRQLADSLPPMVWQTDTEGKQTFASARWKEFTGVDPYNVDTFQQIVHPDDFEGIIKTWQKCLDSGCIYKYEVRLKSKNNAYHWFQVDGQPIYNEQGAIEKWVGAYTDINERKMAEEELKKSEERYHNLIYSSPSAIGILQGEDLVITIANDAILEIWGKGKQIMGKPYFEALPELAEQGYREVFSSVYETGKPFNAVETPVSIMQNGKLELKYYNFLLYPQRNIKGDIEGVGIIATEVTTQAVFNNEIKESEERFRKLSDFSPLFVFLVEPHPDALVSYWNKTWLDYTGQTVEEALGRTWDGIIHPDDLHLVLLVYISAFEKQQAYAIPPIRVKRYDGEYRWHTFKSNPRYSANGEFNGYVGVGFDVHDRIVAETALNKSEKQFSTLVENMENLAWLADSDGYIYWYNKRWYQYTGTTLEEMEGWGWQKVHHPDHVNRVVDFVKVAWYKNEPFELTFPLLGADGQYRWFLTRCFPVTTDDGQIIRWIGTNTDIDEQKKVEQNFRNLADNTPMWVWMADENVNVTYANRDLLRYIGIEHYSQFTGHVWEKVIHPDEIKLIYENFEKSYAAQQPFELECRIKNASTGNYEWHYIKAVPHFEQKNFKGFIGTALNTQQQKDAIDILEYRKALLEAHTQGNLDGVLLVDARGKIISYNKRFIEIWNMPQHIVNAKDDEAALSYAMMQLVNPQQFIDKVKYLYENPTETSIDELEFKDGKIVERYGYPVVGEEGTYYAWSWIFRDVTSQKEAEKIIRDSEERFRVMAELLPEKVSYANPDGKVIYYNQNWVDYTGYNVEKLHGEGWTSMVHPDDIDETQKQWKESLETGNDYEIGFRLRNKNGEYRWHLSRAVALKDEEGNITKWISAATEIQKIKEEEERKGDFLKMVSHELKTPVTSIKGYVQLLLSILKAKEEIQSAVLETPLIRINNQIGRLGRLITEMLDLSRLESGKLEMQKEVFNLDELLIETVQDIKFTNTNHDISISLEDTGQVLGDKNRIGQVIINLINNAIKYSPDNSNIEARIHAAGNNQVAVSIKDYGIGVDKEDQSKIFDRFYRAGGESEKKYSGFGIGLFIAKEIIERHNGLLTVESEKGKGSVFTFILSLATENKKIN